jgi:hypothetical protein
LEKQRMRAVVHHTKRSREMQELRQVISSHLSEVLTEVERLGPLQEAPAGVDQFVAATRRTLAVLREEAGDDRGPAAGQAVPARMAARRGRGLLVAAPVGGTGHGARRRKPLG